MSNVDGIVSGLSTSTLITQLMSLEKQGQTRLTTQKTAVQDDIKALQAVNLAVGSLRSLASDMVKPTTWSAMSASSSNTAVATVSAGATATPGAFAFHVDHLAKAASMVSTGTVGSLGATIASGPLTITKAGGSPVSVDVGDGSLASVVAAVNQSGTGVKAAAVEVASGQLKLQLTASATGTAAAFTVGGTLLGIGSLTELQAAQDAQLTVGSGAASYTITSATNAVTALPGVTINLKAEGDTSVDVSRDSSKVADKVQELVNAVNAARTAITSRSGYDASTKTAGVLLGESSVQSFVSSLSEAITGTSGALNPGIAGIALSRDGSTTFDRGKFIAAFDADPEGITRRLTTGDPGSGPVRLLNAANAVRPGTYDVVVTSAATRATRTGATVATLGAQTIDVKVGTTTASYAVADGATIEAVAAGLTASMAAKGFGMTASVDAGRLVLRTSAYGTNAGFSVRSTATDSGLVSTAGTYEAVAGTDVAGTINGLVANGKGQVLTGVNGTATAGLAVTATASGTLTYAPGVVQRVASLADKVSDPGTGSLTRLIQGKNDRVASLTSAISAWDIRLALREQTIRTQFTNMESALGKLKNQSTWLAGQLGSLPSGNG
jgi:flagellar hook-associated protein 2